MSEPAAPPERRLRGDAGAGDPAGAARGVPRPRLARLLLPEGGVGAARHALRDRSRRPRVRARHPRPLPRDLRRSGARSSAATGSRWRSSRADLARAGVDPRRGALGAQARPLLRDPQGRAARPRARAASTPGSPGCAATSRRPAPTRRRSAGTQTTSSGRQTRSPTGTTTRCFAYIARARPALQRAPRPRLRLDRLHALHAARRRPRGPLGGHREDRVRPAHLGRRRRRGGRAVNVSGCAGFVLWLTGLSAAGQVDDRRPRRRRARARGRRWSTASTATSCASTSRRGSASRRRTATRTSSASAGSPRASPAPAPP